MTEDRDTRIEERIMRLTIDLLLVAGYLLSVNDGEEITLRYSRDAEAVFKAMRTTNEDYLIVSTPRMVELGLGDFGWVRFIYGNAGHEVINDYTTNLEAVFKLVNDLVDKLEARS